MVKLEVCCGSYDDAISAFEGGAKRIELTSALFLGGLTPTVSCLELIKKKTDLEAICMVRTRGGGFVYNHNEYSQMKHECETLLKNGADGIVFGFLHHDFTIDIDKTKTFVNLIHKHGKVAVFHRAFDLLKDPQKGIELLIECGVDRVLTSGLKPKAIEGIEMIKFLEANYGDQIEILPGSGVTIDNIQELILKTGVNQVHASCKTLFEDNTSTNNGVTYKYNNDKKAYYELVNKYNVSKLVQIIKKIEQIIK